MVVRVGRESSGALRVSMVAVEVRCRGEGDGDVFGWWKCSRAVQGAIWNGLDLGYCSCFGFGL